MPGPSALIVEDNLSVRQMLKFFLSSEGYVVYSANDAKQAFDLLNKKLPDIILLDWMMPGMSGYDAMMRLRSQETTRHIPVIMLTAKTEEEDKIKALLGGADDYITKPFSPREVMTRIKVLLRRAKPHAVTDEVIFGPITLQPAERCLMINNHVVSITSTEFNLLLFFIKHPGRAYSRTQILDHVWGVNKFIEERTIDVHIRRLRKVLNPYGLHSAVETVHGFGYRMRNLTKGSSV